MKVLDLDMDYFMRSVATFINESEPERLSEDDYGGCIGLKEKLGISLKGILGFQKITR